MNAQPTPFPSSPQGGFGNGRLLLWAVAALATAWIAADSWYIVPQTQQALLLQFRDIVRVTDQPGIHWKIPGIQEVAYIEKRILSVDTPPQEVLLAEQKPLEVDAFARYKIIDPVLYIKKQLGKDNVQDQLKSFLVGQIRDVLGTVKMATLLSPDRVSVMGKIKDLLNKDTKDFGIEIVDVRILRADLPAKTGTAVFNRMRSEREQEAAQLRATGQQEALKTKAEANRQATIIVAEAQGQAERLKGEGDRKALQLVTEAANRDPQFYAYWRTLAAYRESLPPTNTTYLLTPDNPFLKQMDQK